MFTVGLPAMGLTFFAAASMMIAIPSGVQIFCWLATMWLGRPRLQAPMLYVLGFVFVFVAGGLTGVMVAAVPFDWQVHDSHFVVAHMHYVLIGGAVFPLLAGLHFWFPKVVGKMMSERLGKISFWIFFIGFNITFFPLHQLGMQGVPRRVYTYLPETGWGLLNLIATGGAYLMAIGLVLVLWNVYRSYVAGEPASADPWEADTLEWSIASPPPVYNFATIPVVHDRHPLWTGAAPGDAPRLTGLELIDPEQPRRETIATTILDAEPEARRILPGPSLWPMALAASVAVMAIGSMIDLWFVPIGGVLTIISMIGWLRPPRREAMR